LPNPFSIDVDSLSVMTKTCNINAVGYFEPDNIASYEAFKSVAESAQENYLFAVSNDNTLATSEGVSVPGFALCRVFDSEKKVAFSSWQ